MLQDEEPGDDENRSYLIATGIVHGLAASSTSDTPNTIRDFDAAIDRLLPDYLGVAPHYSNKDFERLFRMSRQLFQRV